MRGAKHYSSLSSHCNRWLIYRRYSPMLRLCLYCRYSVALALRQPSHIMSCKAVRDYRVLRHTSGGSALARPVVRPPAPEASYYPSLGLTSNPSLQKYERPCSGQVTARTPCHSVIRCASIRQFFGVASGQVYTRLSAACPNHAGRLAE